jgi:Fibronectin type III domain/Protein of unknown function (DUF2510)
MGMEGDVMTTPPMAPAGWYADPASRHENRYWDGTGWTASVADRGVTAADPLESPPLPAEASPATATAAPATAAPATAAPATAAPATSAPATAAPAMAAPAMAVSATVAPATAATATPQRGRSRRTVLVAVIAVVAVLALIVGLLLWAPWESPPLLRPAGLAAGPSTTSSVAFRWSGPAAGPPPDRYQILHDAKVIGSVPGTVTSYQVAGLAPATAYQYRVAAVRGGKRSALSAVLVVHTSIPPLSAARLQGAWTVHLKMVRGASTLTGHKNWDESWLGSPACVTGPCDVRLSGSLNGHAFRTTLSRAGAAYQGTVVGNVFPCGSGSGSFAVRSTAKIQLSVITARVGNGAWIASSWAGTMVVNSPYTASGSFYCPASQRTATLSGSP